MLFVPQQRRRRPGAHRGRPGCTATFVPRSTTRCSWLADPARWETQRRRRRWRRRQAARAHPVRARDDGGVRGVARRRKRPSRAAAAIVAADQQTGRLLASSIPRTASARRQPTARRWRRSSRGARCSRRRSLTSMPGAHRPRRAAGSSRIAVHNMPDAAAILFAFADDRAPASRQLARRRWTLLKKGQGRDGGWGPYSHVARRAVRHGARDCSRFKTSARRPSPRRAGLQRRRRSTDALANGRGYPGTTAARRWKLERDDEAGRTDELRAADLDDGRGRCWRSCETRRGAMNDVSGSYLERAASASRARA